MIHIDFETFSSVDLKTAGMHRYVESPDFEILLMAYAENDAPAVCIDLTESPSERRQAMNLLRSLCADRSIKVAHNAPFEMNAIQRVGIHVTLEDWRCTAVMATYLSLPRSLGELSEIMKLPMDKAKDKDGKRLIQMFCKPRKPTKSDPRTRFTRETHPEDWKRFMEYCRMDVEAEREIYNRLLPVAMPEFEWERWFFDQRVNQRGMLVDIQHVEAAIEVDREYRHRLMDEAKRLTGLHNPNSAKQLLEWLATEMPEEEVESLKKEEVKRLLGVVDDAMVERVLQIRQELAKTSVRKYNALRRAVCKDNRLRGSLLFYGASRTHRWSGKMFQPHNLPQNHMSDLEGAREVLQLRDVDVIDFLYGSTSRTLSELIRTSIVAPPGKKFIVADFSAIEARMLAWLAGEEWVLDVFRTHGKIYEATASQMFKVPFESVTKGSSLRQRGKVATLALGYGGGAGALEAMDTAKAIPPEERDPLKVMWRDANPHIVKWWWQVGDAAIEAAKNPGIRFPAGKVSFIREKGFLFCDMPDGNRLAYPRPKIKWDEKFNREVLTYEGVDQKHPKWGEIRTYGPKLVENCLSGEALILTQKGFKRLQDLQDSDRVWDGNQLVRHMGLIQKGLAYTISVDGVLMTPEHRVLTEGGWTHASSCEGHHRATPRTSDGCRVPRIERKEVTLGREMRVVWKSEAHEGIPLPHKHIVRMLSWIAHLGKGRDTRNVAPSGLRGVEIDDRPLQTANTQGLAPVRRAGNNRRSVLGVIRSLLGRHGADVQKRSHTGPDRQRRGILERELPLGNPARAGGEHETRNHCVGKAVETMVEGSGDPHVYPVLSVQEGPQAPRTVYDIRNCGPENRFVVFGRTGPLIVHNCTQSLSRSALVEGMLAVEDAGYEIVLHVHDEAVVEADEDVEVEVIEKLLAHQPDWAPDLPLRADGFESTFYRKDG